MEYPCI